MLRDVHGLDIRLAWQAFIVGEVLQTLGKLQFVYWGIQLGGE